MGDLDREFPSPSTPPEEPIKTRKKPGPKPGSKRGQKKAEEPPVPPTPKPPELTDEDWLTFQVALITIFSLLDDGLWFLGMDTDVDLGGLPVMALDKDEAEKLAHSFQWIVRKRPAFARQVLVVNEAYHHYESGMILGSRLVAVAGHFFKEGLNIRTNKAEYAKMLMEEAARNGRGA